MTRRSHDARQGTIWPAHGTFVSGGNDKKRAQKAENRGRPKTKPRPIEKRPLKQKRIRKIRGSFAFIPHRFLRDGFWDSLDHHQLLLYIFLVIVADRHGLSYYSYDKICTLLRICVDEYIFARNALIDADLIAFDGYLYQVLSLPDQVVQSSPTALSNQEQLQKHDPATVRQIIVHSLENKP